MRKNAVAYRREWMMGKAPSLTTPGSIVAKAGKLHVLLQHLSDGWKRRPDEYGNHIITGIAKAAGRTVADEELDGYGGTLLIGDCLAVPMHKFDGYLHRTALAYAHQQDDEPLNTALGA